MYGNYTRIAKLRENSKFENRLACVQKNGKNEKSLFPYIFIYVLCFYFSSEGVTPANSGSTKMRPQFSHTMIFLRKRISICL